MTTGLDDPQPRFRLLHSSGELFAAARAAALAQLGDLPGAKLFVLPARAAPPPAPAPGAAPRRAGSRGHGQVDDRP